MNEIDLVYICETNRDAEIQRDKLIDMLYKSDIKNKKWNEIELISGVRIYFVTRRNYWNWSHGKTYLILNSADHRIYHSGYPEDLGG